MQFNVQEFQITTKDTKHPFQTFVSFVYFVVHTQILNDAGLGCDHKKARPRSRAAIGKSHRLARMLNALGTTKYYFQPFVLFVSFVVTCPNHGKTMGEILFKDESYKIMGAMFEVYKEMGCGFLEQVYQECVELELKEQQVPFVAQAQVELKYKHHQLNSKFVPDLICYGKIVLELKAVKLITDEHRAQVHNYLKATGVRLGIIVNFGHFPKVEYERIVR